MILADAGEVACATTPGGGRWSGEEGDELLRGFGGLLDLREPCRLRLVNGTVKRVPSVLPIFNLASSAKGK